MNIQNFAQVLYVSAMALLMLAYAPGCYAAHKIGSTGSLNNKSGAAGSLNLIAEAISRESLPWNQTYSPVNDGATVFGGSQQSTADSLNLKVFVKNDTGQVVDHYQWEAAWSPSGVSPYPNDYEFHAPVHYPGTGSATLVSDIWNIPIVKPIPGSVTFKCKVFFTGGDYAISPGIKLQIGIRTDDIITLGWINGDVIGLPTSSVSKYIKDIFPPGGPSVWGNNPTPVAVALAFVIRMVGTDPVGIKGTHYKPDDFTFSDKDYILNWLFKFAGNIDPTISLKTVSGFTNPPRGDFASPRGSYVDYNKVKVWVTTGSLTDGRYRNNYKVFNHLQVQFTVGDTAFNGLDVCHYDVQAGMTKNPLKAPESLETQLGAGLTDFPVPFPNYILSISDVSPDQPGVIAFNYCMGTKTQAELNAGEIPLWWEDVGSQIRFTNTGGTTPTVLTVGGTAPSLGPAEIRLSNFPTFYVYTNGVQTDTRPQATRIESHFFDHPYPFGAGGGNGDATHLSSDPLMRKPGWTIKLP